MPGTVHLFPAYTSFSQWQKSDSKGKVTSFTWVKSAWHSLTDFWHNIQFQRQKRKLPSRSASPWLSGGRKGIECCPSLSTGLQISLHFYSVGSTIWNWGGRAKWRGEKAVGHLGMQKNIKEEKRQQLWDWDCSVKRRDMDTQAKKLGSTLGNTTAREM